MLFRDTASGARVQTVSDFLASLNILFCTVNELLVNRLRDELGDELTIPQYRLIKLIDRTRAQRVGTVASFLGVSNAAASKAVERLVRRNLLRRIESADDRRISGLTLTEKGKTLLARYERVHHDTLSRLFRDDPSAALSQAAQFVDRLSVEVLHEENVGKEACFRCGIYFREQCLLRNITERTCYCNLHGVDEGNDTG